MGKINCKNRVREFMQECFKQEPILGLVLEIGSGRDRFARDLFSKRYKVITSNIYPKNVVDYICNISCLPFENNKFGCVICEHVLEHVDEPAKAIDEIRRVLRPNGLLILTVPLSWSIHDKPYDLWRFTDEGLRYLLSGEFVDVKFESIGNPKKPALVCLSARKPVNKTKKITARPKVSIIMPTYNRAHIIDKSIESVINQTFKDWELVIVSDGSTDNTRQVVSKYKDPRISFFQKKHAGCSAARNYALRRARGRYIAYCDDDDTFFPYHLEKLIYYLDAHPEVEMAKGDYVNLIIGTKEGHRAAGVLVGSVHRRRALQKVGLFDNRLVVHEDTDMLLRFFDSFSVKPLDIISVKRYIHKDNSIIKERKCLLDVCDKIYSGRVNPVYKRLKIRKEELILVAYLISSQIGRPKTVVKIAHLFHRLTKEKHNDLLAANYFVGISYYMAGNYSNAIRFLKEAVKLCLVHPKRLNADMHSILELSCIIIGKIYISNDEYKKASAYFKRCFKLNPKNPIIKNLLLIDNCGRAGRGVIPKNIIKTGRMDEQAIEWFRPLIAFGRINRLKEADTREARDFLFEIFGDIKPVERIL